MEGMFLGGHWRGGLLDSREHARHLEAKPTPALGDDVLGQQLSACFVSDASHERHWSLAEVSEC